MGKIGSIDEKIWKKRLNKIPQQMKAITQWVAWRQEGLKKIPINPATGSNARVNDRETWGTFVEAVEACLERGFDGIGFVLTADDPFTAIDLDECRDIDTGKLTPKAEAIVDQVWSYTEASPSATGLHIVVKGKIARNIRKKGIEIYSSKHFMTVTGRCLFSNLIDIAPREDQLSDLFTSVAGQASVLVKREDSARNVGLSEVQRKRIFREAEGGRDGAKFRKLWDGDFSDYDSQSEADLALCRIIARHSGCRKNSIDALFRESALYRPKWDEPRSADQRTYGQITVSKAVSRAHQEWDRSWGVFTGPNAMETAGEVPEYWVEGLVPKQTLGIWVGNSGIGKSALLYQLGICMAAGIPFLGHKIRRGEVLYLDYENGTLQAHELVRRISSYLGLQELPSKFRYWNVNSANDSWGTPGKQALDMIKAYKPDLVVLDSFTAFQPDVELRNSNATLTIQKLRALTKNSNTSVIMTHHLSKPNARGNHVEKLIDGDLSKWFLRVRGASAIVNATDVRIGIEQPSGSIANSEGKESEVAFVIRGFERLTGEIPLLSVQRLRDDQGEPMGYCQLVGAQNLQNAQQQETYSKLPAQFRFKEAKLVYGKSDQPTINFLRKCITLKIIEKTATGYRKI